jgi:hypothetical protein
VPVGSSSPRSAAALITAWVCIAVVAVLGLTRLDEALGTFDQAADENAARAYLDRVYGDQTNILGSRRVVEDARLTIPETDTYRMVLGPIELGRYNALIAPDFVRYFLLPRREAPDARWILCFACDVDELGPGFEVLSKENDIVFGRLRE